MKIKRLLNKLGYDVKKYHPTFETTIRSLGINTVLDIGANMGHYARDMRRLLPDAYIYSFEPLSECFSGLNNMMAGDQRFKSFNIALGDSSGKTEIKKSSFHPSSSILPMLDLHKKLYPKSATSVTETIRIERLDDVMRSEKIIPSLLIKIDVQGFEDKVIRGGRETIRSADAVVIETSYVPLYKGQPLFDDIYMLMRELGFFYYGDLHRHYAPDNNKLIYEDSLFLKNPIEV